MKKQTEWKLTGEWQRMPDDSYQRMAVDKTAGNFILTVRRGMGPNWRFEFSSFVASVNGFFIYKSAKTAMKVCDEVFVTLHEIHRKEA